MKNEWETMNTTVRFLRMGQFDLGLQVVTNIDENVEDEVHTTLFFGEIPLVSIQIGPAKECYKDGEFDWERAEQTAGMLVKDLIRQAYEELKENFPTEEAE